ncbi:GtrA family protein [Aeromicrobium choanae]|uniref:Putative flippase GtrA (Transmembrane translocase of bactoprenol-linked glucose) n=1 Tax=Aeromicrobium choanae TaxID=1736691 RepID=A0A1T4YXV9_9ACTN|nr:GtrA family protein [Aeromicrobium choanae]SKB06483.1 Putative flippase GtrA (transmembrane translocase of bactoprenol-linked glucose) [Aeromicrobium choanae]
MSSSAARYLVVGLLSYLIDVGILAAAWHLLDLPLWLATSLGFWTSFVANFLLSRHWTFESSRQPSGGQLARYVSLVAVNYVVTLVAVTVLHEAGLKVIVARTVVLALLTATTYLLYRRWVFTDRTHDHD